jgi:hypothetical protein
VSRHTAYHTVQGSTQADGSVVAHHATNDNLDHGEPGEYASWRESYRTAQSFFACVGGCRTGFLGSVVTVTLDGNPVSQERAAALACAGSKQ